MILEEMPVAMETECMPEELVLPVMFFMFLFNVSSFPLMFYVLYVLFFVCR